MQTLINIVTDPGTMVVILIAIAAFATVASLIMPIFAADRFGSRMKYVSSERDKLRSERVAAMADEHAHARLRKEPKSFMKQVVENFNLSRALETHTTRDRLKMAGCDAMMLGCTEFPLISDDTKSSLPTLDSTRLLARAALRRAMRADQSTG